MREPDASALRLRSAVEAREVSRRLRRLLLFGGLSRHVAAEVLLELGEIDLEAVEDRAPVAGEGGHGDGLADLLVGGARAFASRVSDQMQYWHGICAATAARSGLDLRREGRLVAQFDGFHLRPGAGQTGLGEAAEEARHLAEGRLDILVGGVERGNGIIGEAATVGATAMPPAMARTPAVSARRAGEGRNPWS